jgi:cell division protein FtsA
LAEKAQLTVKRGVAKRVYINNAAELLQNPFYTQALGLLLFANENCEKKEVVAPQPIYTAPIIEKPVVQEKVEEEEDEEEEETPQPKKGKKNKDDKKQKSLFDFFEKIQNFGGTMFKEED